MATDPSQRAPRSLTSAGLRSALRFIRAEEASDDKLWLYGAKSVSIPPMRDGESEKAGIQFELAIGSPDNPRVALTLATSDERLALAQQLKAGPIGPVWLVKIERKKGNPFWAFSDATAPSSSVSSSDNIDNEDLPF